MRATACASSSASVGRECGITSVGSNVKQQPDRLERLRVLHARLDPAKVRARDGQLEDRQVLDVGLGYLRAMRLQARELPVQHLLDVGIAVRRELVGGRDLAVEEVGAAR